MAALTGLGWNVHSNAAWASSNTNANIGRGMWVRVDFSTLTPAQCATLVSGWKAKGFQVCGLLGQEMGAVTAALAVGRTRDILIACAASPMDAFEVYNEQDQGGGNAVTYTRSADDLRRIRAWAFNYLPTAQIPMILGGGMAGWDSRAGSHNVNDWFLPWIAAGGHTYCDGIAMHLYYYNAAVNTNNLSTSAAAMKAEIQALVGGKPIIVTERGFGQTEVEARKGSAWDATTAAGYYSTEVLASLAAGMPYATYDTYGANADADVEFVTSAFAAKAMLTAFNTNIAGTVTGVGG